MILQTLARFNVFVQIRVIIFMRLVNFMMIAEMRSLLNGMGRHGLKLDPAMILYL